MEIAFHRKKVVKHENIKKFIFTLDFLSYLNISNEELKAKIKECGPWRHDIDFGNGIRTRDDNLPAHNPERRWKILISKMFPEDMSGMTVLDVGCNSGFYSVKMKQRGAERVVSLDIATKNIKQTEFLSEWNNVKLEIIQQDLLEFVLTTNEVFDYVIFSRVFYHLRYPNLILDRLAQMTNKKMIFLTETIGSDESITPKEDYVGEEKSELLELPYPKMFFIEKKYASDKTNWWVTNQSANQALIRASGLRIVDHPRSGVYLCEPKNKTKPVVINNRTLYFPDIPKFLDK